MPRGKRIRRFVKRVRGKRAKGTISRREAFLGVGAERKRKIVGAEGKLFLEAGPEEALERVKKRVLPRLGRVRRPRGEKRKLLRELFSAKGAQLGLVLVKPGLLGKSGSIRAFLRELGCELVYSKPMMLTRRHLRQVYPHAIKDYKYFAMHALDLLSGPSRVIVFRHMPKEQYIERSRFLKYLQRTNPRKFEKLRRAVERATESQNVFNILFKGSFERVGPGTLRGDIVYPALRELGFGKREVKGLAEKIDALGFYQHQFATNPRFKTMSTMSGLHIPATSELFRDTNTFLSIENLRAIKRRLKG